MTFGFSTYASLEFKAQRSIYKTTLMSPLKLNSESPHERKYRIAVIPYEENCALA